MKNQNLSDEQLRRCIFQGSTFLVGVVTLIVGLCVYNPFLESATTTPLFRNVALGSLLLSLLVLIFTELGNSYTFNKLAKLMVVLAMTMCLVLVAHSLSSKAIAIVSMATAAVIMGISAYAGSRMRDASSMRGPLFVGFFVLLLSGFLNRYIFAANWMETAYSILAIVLFTIASLYETNMFVKHRHCRFDCCEEGVFSLYGNFANIAANLMRLAD